MTKWKPNIAFRKAFMPWWNALSLDEKQSFKKKYEGICEKNFKSKSPYPHMIDTTITRISKLSENQIYCIYRFRENKN